MQIHKKMTRLEGLQDGELQECFTRWLWENVVKLEYHSSNMNEDLVFLDFGLLFWDILLLPCFNDAI